MPLNELAVKKAPPKSKPYKLADGNGMFLLVNPTGSKLWRFKYRFGGKEKLLALGIYPEVTLKDARGKRDEARQLIAKTVDPSVTRRAQKNTSAGVADNSFEVVAREWFELNTVQWVKGHADKIIARLERDVFPWIGNRVIGELAAPEIMAVLRRIEGRGAIETAHRANQNLSQIFRYAIVTGRATHDVAADLRGALPHVVSKHQAAITEPKQVGGLIRAIREYKGSEIVKSALKLAPLVFLRPGELRQGEWTEIDLVAAEWRIPAEKMKMRVGHIVPLALQAVQILTDLKPLTGGGRYLFPSPRTTERPLSDNAVLSALRRMGFEKDEMSGHGFRAMARTILDEVLHVRPDYIDHQLAHAVRDPNGRAYNRTTHLDERRKMMQLWADYLDALAAGDNVVFANFQKSA